MGDALLAVLIAVFTWWFCTGAILVLHGLARRSSAYGHLWSAAAVLAAGAALFGAVASGDLATPTGAYLGFASGVAVWGVLEFAFLEGWLTGARRTPCPPGATGWRRFVYAVEALLHHELALFVTGALLCGLMSGAANGVALWTFLILWAMRQSAKLNIFLGVPNLSTELLPKRIAYLASYFRVAPMNWMFPISATAGTVAGVLVTIWAAGAASGGHEQIGATLLASLIWLGVIEHWFLVLPIPDAALWRWMLPAARTAEGVPDRR